MPCKYILEWLRMCRMLPSSVLWSNATILSTLIMFPGFACLALNSKAMICSPKSVDNVRPRLPISMETTASYVHNPLSTTINPANASVASWNNIQHCLEKVQMPYLLILGSKRVRHVSLPSVYRCRCIWLQELRPQPPLRCTETGVRGVGLIFVIFNSWVCLLI